MKFINLDGTIKKSSSSRHQKYDVHPYLAEYDNWGNAAELIYGNSKNQRKNNGDYYYRCSVQDVYDSIWKGKLKNEKEKQVIFFHLN